MRFGITPGVYFDYGRVREWPASGMSIVGTSSLGPVGKPSKVQTIGTFYYYFSDKPKKYERVTAKNLRLLAKKRQHDR